MNAVPAFNRTCLPADLIVSFTAVFAPCFIAFAVAAAAVFCIDCLSPSSPVLVIAAFAPSFAAA